jgi:CheY-like chemotaxis protein
MRVAAMHAATADLDAMFDLLDVAGQPGTVRPRSSRLWAACRGSFIEADRSRGVVVSRMAGRLAAWHDASTVTMTVLVVDDHAGFRASVRALLETEGFQVVGEAADGLEALTEAAALRPAVVLLDVQLPGLDGLAVAEALAARPYPPVVVLTSSRDASAYGPRLARAAALGFIAKADLTGATLAAVLLGIP